MIQTQRRTSFSPSLGEVFRQCFSLLSNGFPYESVRCVNISEYSQTRVLDRVFKRTHDSNFVENFFAARLFPTPLTEFRNETILSNGTRPLVFDTSLCTFTDTDLIEEEIWSVYSLDWIQQQLRINDKLIAFRALPESGFYTRTEVH